MGIIFVLILYFVALSVLALICSVILTACASWYLRGKAVKRRKLRIVASIFPFACVFYAGIWFVAYAAINGFVFHRDPMLGDGWYTDIPGGYAIEMIDVTDQGYLHPTGTDINGNSTVQGVRRLQIAGKQIYGARDTRSFDHLGTDSNAEDVFFVLDTTSRSTRDFATESLLQNYAATQGVHLSLLPIERVYGKYRFGWFDWVSWAILIGVPAAAFILLVRWFVESGAAEFVANANADSLRE